MGIFLCPHPHHCVHIKANSRNFQDQNHFLGLFRPGNFTKNFQNFPGGMGTLNSSKKLPTGSHHCQSGFSTYYEPLHHSHTYVNVNFSNPYQLTHSNVGKQCQNNIIIGVTSISLNMICQCDYIVHTILPHGSTNG